MKPEWWRPLCKNISLILAARGCLLSSRPIIMTQSMGAKAKDRWTPLAVDCAQLPKYCRKRPWPKHDLHESPCLMTPRLLLYDIHEPELPGWTVDVRTLWSSSSTLFLFDSFNSLCVTARPHASWDASLLLKGKDKIVIVQLRCFLLSATSRQWNRPRSWMQHLNYRAKHATFCDVRVKPRFRAMTQHMAIESGAGFDSMDFDLNKSIIQRCAKHTNHHNHQIIWNRCLWHSYLQCHWFSVFWDVWRVWTCMLMYRILPACLKSFHVPLRPALHASNAQQS